jgi:hypothetical protein
MRDPTVQEEATGTDPAGLIAVMTKAATTPGLAQQTMQAAAKTAKGRAIIPTEAIAPMVGIIRTAATTPMADTIPITGITHTLTEATTPTTGVLIAGMTTMPRVETHHRRQKEIRLKELRMKGRTALTGASTPMVAAIARTPKGTIPTMEDIVPTVAIIRIAVTIPTEGHTAGMTTAMPMERPRRNVPFPQKETKAM